MTGMDSQRQGCGLRHRHRVMSVLLAAVLASGLGAWTAAAAPGQAVAAAHLRVDQGGYVVDQRGQAFLMTSKPARGTGFEIRSADRVVASGRVGVDRGRWNAAYPHTYALSIPALRRTGTYR